MINAPLHPETENLFNDALIGQMKRGAYLVNTARGKTWLTGEPFHWQTKAGAMA